MKQLRASSPVLMGFLTAVLVWLALPMLAPSDLLNSGAGILCVSASAVAMGVLAGLWIRRRNAAAEANRDLTRCRECGYLLRGLVEARCPECGTPFDPELSEQGGS